MRLKTIWTLRGMALKERFRRTGEWAAMEVAIRLPQKIKYWVAVLEIGKVTSKTPGKPVMDITLDEILSKLDAG